MKTIAQKEMEARELRTQKSKLKYKKSKYCKNAVLPDWGENTLHGPVKI